MANRPKLPRHILAEIEQARQRLFDAKEAFNLIFLRPYSALEFFTSLQTNAPRQRMPETLKLQFQDLVTSLFDVEAKYYRDLAANQEELLSWLNDLSARIEEFVKFRLADQRHDFHCSLEDRKAAVADALKDRIAQWIELTGEDQREVNARATVTDHTRLDLPGQRPIFLLCHHRKLSANKLTACAMNAISASRHWLRRLRFIRQM